MPRPVPPSILSHFAALEDPRQHAKVLYPLVEILLLALAATVAGANDFVETTLWGAEKQAFLRRFFPYENGIPSHDTLCDVFAAIDPVLFKSCFLAWVEDLRDGAPEVIAIDGKTSRCSHDRRKGRKPLHMVSAWATNQRIVLGQQATEEKSNEITAIPLLLKSLDPKGALVTIDAMGTQTRIAQTIRDGGGDYILSLKENWPATFAEIRMLFDQPPAGTTFETNETVDGCNGRIATHRHTVCHEIGWMTSDRRYPGEPRFPDPATIGRVETTVERDGTIQRETRYYVCSTPLGAAVFGRIVRGHWGIESRLRWVLDVVDLARLRSGNAPANMAIVRHTALNLLSGATPTTGFKNHARRRGGMSIIWKQCCGAPRDRSSDSPAQAALEP
jgi:predicted transposase YbfD/YdcC